jgi:hypothetical protein
MTGARRTLLLFLCSAGLAGAQAPTINPVAMGNRLEPLQVLDDAGRVITEQEIQARLQPRYGRRLYVVGMLAGLLVGTVVSSQPERECSIYEPCSPREEFTKGNAWWVGLVTGTLLGFSIPDGVNREQAVARIRAERRASAGTPP